MIGQVWRRLQLMYAVGTGTVIGKDKIQVTILDGETLNNIDRVEMYGFSYRPKPGCRPYLSFPAGDRSHGFALIIGDKRYQMDLQEGEVALHDDEEGSHVLLKRGGIIEAKAATKVIADTPLFETTHDAKIGGNLVVVGTTHLQQVVNCDMNMIVAGNTVSAMVLAGGFSSLIGGAAVMQQGLSINGVITVNGKNIGDSHTHTVTAFGEPSSGVN
jgi:phage gp45-like